MLDEVSNGTHTVIELLLDTRVNGVFLDWNGNIYVIKCPFFIPCTDKVIVKCNTTDKSTDKIHCGRYPRKTRPYRIRSAYICWKHALRHGYAEVIPQTLQGNLPCKVR